jgi:hypothetical protein
VSTDEAHAACSIEMSRRITQDPAAGYNLKEIIELIQSNRNEHLHEAMFGIVVAGFIQYDPDAIPLELFSSILSC